MKKVVVIGAGIAGLTAATLLAKAGFDVTVLENNSVVGGMCSSWTRNGYVIDNCIHWLTGTKDGTAMNELWREIGALGDDIPIYRKEMFCSVEQDGQTITLWRDKERTRREMIALSPEDEAEINKFIDSVALAETMDVPVKPIDAMSLREMMSVLKSLAPTAKALGRYRKMNVTDLAARFKHPLIGKVFTHYLPDGYLVSAFLVSYATVTAGNGDIPLGGSLAMARRIADTFVKYGGNLRLNTPVKVVVLDKSLAKGVLTDSGEFVAADVVVCACDPSFTFGNLLPQKYMPKSLAKLYKNRKGFPVNSGFHVAYAVDGVFGELEGTRSIDCSPFTVGTRKITSLPLQSYDYDPSFAPQGKCVLQSNIIQTEEDFDYWINLRNNDAEYKRVKAQTAQEAMQKVVERYPNLQGKISVLDVWTPATYARRSHAYKGAFMSFMETAKATRGMISDKIKGLKNVYMANQWLMSAGGLPTAASMGKFAAWHIIHSK